MKKLLLLFVVSALIISCGENEQEKQERIAKENMQRIEKETAKILVTYNDAISKQKTNVDEAIKSARFLGLSNMQMEVFYGFDWQQKAWDTLRVYYKIDSLETSFKNTFGEDEYNVLKLKIDENWDKKMNKS